MTKDHPSEHAIARNIIDKLAKAAGLKSGQGLLKHLDSLKADDAGLVLIGEAIKQSMEPPKPAAPTPDDANPPGPKTETPSLAEVG